jgi:hypothetical protein
MGTGGKLLVALGAVALAVALFFVFRPSGDDDGGATTAAETTTSSDEPTTETTGETTTAPPAPPPPPEPAVIRVVIPEGGPTEIQRATVDQGERVVLIVRSAVTDHVHVHGYDLFADVGPSRPARITFRASDPGRFDIELEDRGTPIVDLRVVP